MNILSAIRLIVSAPYVFRRRHEWRGYKVDRADRLWPHITIGWWTWDTLPEGVGRRVAEMVDTMRELPVVQPPLL
jgi:hypothetical protein